MKREHFWNLLDQGFVVTLLILSNYDLDNGRTRHNKMKMNGVEMDKEISNHIINTPDDSMGRESSRIIIVRLDDAMEAIPLSYSTLKMLEEAIGLLPVPIERMCQLRGMYRESHFAGFGIEEIIAHVVVGSGEHLYVSIGQTDDGKRQKFAIIEGEPALVMRRGFAYCVPQKRF